MRHVPLLLLAGCILTEKMRDAEVCSEAPGDTVVAIDASCVDTTPGSLELTRLWSSNVVAWPRQVHATRSVDADGDGDVDAGDAMSIWVEDDTRVVMLDGAGTFVADYATIADWVFSYAGELDADDPGAELFVSWADRGSPTVGGSAFGEAGERWSVAYSAESPTFPTITDLEDDGVAEVILDGRVLSGVDGSVLATLDGTSLGDALRAVAVDLDGDGEREILGGTQRQSRVGLYAADGTLEATCVHAGYSENVAFAVGNLDADTDGEFVAAGTGFLVTCDTDGTLIARAEDASFDQPNVAGLGELDGDPEPEIVVGDDTRIAVFEHDLTPKWEYVDGDSDSWYTFALADLDMDGRHEVLVHLHDHLRILDGSGTEIVREEIGLGDYDAWMTAPIVADVDADGLAEIVAITTSRVRVFENAAGGWNIPEARYPWPGADRHPRQQDVDGTTLPATDWWNEPGSNVFQGLPAGPADLPDLSVSVVEVDADCGDEACVTLLVGNAGLGAVLGTVDVVVTSTAVGDELASARVVTPLASGVGRYVRVSVPSDRLVDGLTVTVAADDLVPECGLAENVAYWEDVSVCP